MGQHDRVKILNRVFPVIETGLKVAPAGRPAATQVDCGQTSAVGYEKDIGRIRPLGIRTQDDLNTLEVPICRRTDHTNLLSMNGRPAGPRPENDGQRAIRRFFLAWKMKAG